MNLFEVTRLPFLGKRMHIHIMQLLTVICVVIEYNYSAIYVLDNGSFEHSFIFIKAYFERF
jgi:hypothetical protein